MFHCEVIDNSKEKITIEKAQKFIESQKCGASLYFLGTVRDHNNDKTVTWLEGKPIAIKTASSL